MSRQLAAGTSFTWRDIYLVVSRQPELRIRLDGVCCSVCFLGLDLSGEAVAGSFFWGFRPFRPWKGLFTVITGTANGLLFVGDRNSLLVQCWRLSCFALPPCPCRYCWIAKMISSLPCCSASIQFAPIRLSCWDGASPIGVLIFLAMVPAFLGLIVVLPILGHATMASLPLCNRRMPDNV